MVAALPERYQPIYGISGKDEPSSRPCGDRAAAIEQVCELLSMHYGRPLRVLDLGCAQGYFSLRLAARGASVVGIDLDERNIALCQALGSLHKGLDVHFECADMADFLGRLPRDGFDLILGLSVFHHLCHRMGRDAVRQLVSTIGDVCDVLVCEQAVADEPMYWAASLPNHPRWLLEDLPFIRMLGSYPTHLSDVHRPMYAASKRLAVLSKSVFPFVHSTPFSHPLVGNAHQGTRWYFFGNQTLLKVFRVNGAISSVNREELSAESDFLRRTPAALPHLPRILDTGETPEEVWLAREAPPGKLLSDALSDGDPLDRPAVLRRVLDELVALETQGLYHTDLKTWNILVTSGLPKLIDYGSIREIKDSTERSSGFLAFFALVAEIASGTLLGSSPFERVLISPLNLPPPYRAWLMHAWRQQPGNWSYSQLRSWLDDALLSEARSEETGEHSPHELWMRATELALLDSSRHITALAARLQEITRDTSRLRDQGAEVAPPLSKVAAPQASDEQLAAERDAARTETGDALNAQIERLVRERDAAASLAERSLADALERLRDLDRAASLGRESLRELESQAAQHASQVQELRGVLDAEKKRTAAVYAELSATAQDLALALVERCRLQTRLAQEEAATAALLAKLREKEEQCNALCLDKEAADRHGSTLHHQLLLAQSELSGLRNSRSWRITKPLRALFSLFRRRGPT